MLIVYTPPCPDCSPWGACPKHDYGDVPRDWRRRPTPAHDQSQPERTTDG